MTSVVNGRLSPRFLEQLGILSEKVALRKDGLCRKCSVSPRALKPDERVWYRSAMECDVQEIRFLLDRNPCLADKKDTVMGFTALHWGAKKGNYEMVELLAGTEMDLNIKTRGGYTALHFAVIHSNEGIISMLVDDYGADINVRDNSGRKPKHYLKDTASPWIQRKLGKAIKQSVSFSRESKVMKSLGTMGTLLVPMSPLSSSLESGLDKIGMDDVSDNDEERQDLSPRRGAFAKFCQNIKSKSKRGSNPFLELPSPDAFKYRRTGRAKSAPDINNVADFSPRMVLTP